MLLHSRISVLTIGIYMTSWVDAHANLPTPGKVERESECDLKQVTKREASTLL